MSRSLCASVAVALLVACGSASAAELEGSSQPAVFPRPPAPVLMPAGDRECSDGQSTYCIECWIIGTDASGKELTITAPKVSVFENQQASVRDVSQTPRPGKTQQIEWLE